MLEGNDGDGNCGTVNCWGGVEAVAVETTSKDCWANIACKEVRRVCNCKICFDYKVELVVLAPGKEKWEIVGLNCLCARYGERKWKCQMVGSADESDKGGSIEGISSILSGSIDILKMWVSIKSKRKHGGH